MLAGYHFTYIQSQHNTRKKSRTIFLFVNTLYFESIHRKNIPINYTDLSVSNGRF